MSAALQTIRRWWIAVEDWFGFYVPADVSPDMPQSLAEFRARRARQHTPDGGKAA